MPWVGVSESVEEERARALIESLGLRIDRVVGVVELETSRGWLKFRVFEVRGEVQGVAQVLASELSLPAFESGPHLVLGEVSARLWDEGARVAFPDGGSEVIPIFTYDGFLDIRMPTRKTRGLKATMVVGGRTFELPLQLKDLLEIYAQGRKALEKVDKAVAAYGLEKVVSSEALEELRRLKQAEEVVEVDFDAGFVMVREGSRARVVSLERFFLEMIYRKRLDRVKEIMEKAPSDVRERLRRLVEAEYNDAKLSGDERRVKDLVEACKELGLPLPEEGQARSK